MNSLLQALAIPMRQLQAYSPAHLLIVLAFTAAAFLLAALLKRLRASHAVVITLCGVVLLLSEVLKQLLLTYVRGGSYSWSDLPFQLCSIPMYLCLAYPLLPRARRTTESFLMTFGLLGAVFAFLIPYSSFYHYLLLTGQSLLWHGILLFLAVWLIWERSGPFSLREFLPALSVYLGAALIAVGLNSALYTTSGGSCNMFFLGPGYPDVFILNDIYEGAGWLPETLAMIAATGAGGLLVFFLITRYKNRSRT